MSRNLSMAAAIREVLTEALNSDDGLIVVGETVGRAGGVAGTSQGLLDQFGGDRVIDLPVADRGTAAFAVGHAMGGGRCVLSLSSAGRLPAIAEVLVEATQVSSGEFALPLVIRAPWGNEAPGVDTPVGAALSLLPGLQVVCPADAGQAAGLLRQALRRNAPTLILEPRGLYATSGVVDAQEASLGARTLRQGDHVTIATWGTGVRAALEASDALLHEGIGSAVVDLVALQPIDIDTLGTQLRHTGRLVVAHPDDAALANQVHQAALDAGFLYLESPLAACDASTEAITSAARRSVHF